MRNTGHARLGDMRPLFRARGWTAVLARAIAIWLPIAAAVTGLAGMVYGVGQQNMRSSADDVPLALAWRTAAHLDGGTSPDAVLPADQVDLANSLEPFVLVFDTNGRLLASSATLHGNIPPYPPGVFDTVRARGQNHVTWQPEPGVRNATVAVPWQGGFVVAGRSLELSEQHIDQVALIVGLGWFATQLLVGGAALLASLLNPPDDVPPLSLGRWRIALGPAPNVT